MKPRNRVHSETHSKSTSEQHRIQSLRIGGKGYGFQLSLSWRTSTLRAESGHLNFHAGHRISNRDVISTRVKESAKSLGSGSSVYNDASFPRDWYASCATFLKKVSARKTISRILRNNVHTSRASTAVQSKAHCRWLHRPELPQPLRSERCVHHHLWVDSTSKSLAWTLQD